MRTTTVTLLVAIAALLSTRVEAVASKSKLKEKIQE
jgi:hypothetical protein